MSTLAIFQLYCGIQKVC